jgi:hypothetical protein
MTRLKWVAIGWVVVVMMLKLAERHHGRGFAYEARATITILSEAFRNCFIGEGAGYTP